MNLALSREYCYAVFAIIWAHLPFSVTPSSISLKLFGIALSLLVNYRLRSVHLIEPVAELLIPHQFKLYLRRIVRMRHDFAE
jgi:hypothetical protein